VTVAKSDRRRGEIGPVTYSQDTKAPTAGQPEARIVVHDVSKVFRGNIRAVDRLSFTVEPGSVTGFLGPNGAGKTTTLRMALGLVRPSGGYATIGGRLYRDIANPLAVVGALLESSSFHPARTGRNHLRILCMVAGLPARRADEVLDMVGLHDAAKRKVRGYSLGMRQRLGLAAALVGDPRCSSSTSPPTAWIRKASAGCAASSVTLRARAEPSSCPATSSTKYRRSPTASSSSTAANWCGPARSPSSPQAPTPCSSARRTRSSSPTH